MSLSVPASTKIYSVKQAEINLRKKQTGVFLTLILILLNGSVIFSGNRLLLTLFLGLGIIIFIIQKKKPEKYFFYTIGFLILIIVFQGFSFSFFSLNTTLGTFVRFLLPYFFIRIIDRKFPIYYVSILYFITLISFLFYFPSVIFPQFYTLLQNIPEIVGTVKFGQGTNFLIYTVEIGTRMGFLRNAGLFWEPGAFSGFLILAILLNISITSKLWNRQNMVFILAILTTFSTAGYIALMLIITSYYLINFKRKGVIIIMALLFLTSWYVYFRFDFLNERISSEIELTNKGKGYSGRIGSGIKDWQDIIKYPFFGRGRNVATRFDNYRENEKDILIFHRTNGVTDFMVKYGLLFSVFYFFSIYKSMNSICLYYRFNVKFAFFMFLIILTIGFSQTFFQGSLFISLIYLHTIFREPAKFLIGDKFHVENFSRNSNLQQKARIM